MTAAGCGDQVLVHADSPIRSIADLRGKSIAVGKGSSAHGHILGSAPGGRADTGRCEPGVPAARRCIVGVHAARGRRMGDMGSVHRTGRDADPGAEHRPGQGRHQRCGVRDRVRVGAGRPEAQHRVGRLLQRYAKAARWANDNPEEWARQVRRGGRSRIRRSPRWRRAEACGCPPTWPISWSHPNRKLADLFAAFEQIAVCTRVLADWVDRRFTDALRPLYINRS